MFVNYLLAFDEHAQTTGYKLAAVGDQRLLGADGERELCCRQHREIKAIVAKRSEERRGTGKPGNGSDLPLRVGDRACDRRRVDVIDHDDFHSERPVRRPDDRRSSGDDGERGGADDEHGVAELGRAPAEGPCFRNQAICEARASERLHAERVKLIDTPTGEQ